MPVGGGEGAPGPGGGAGRIGGWTRPAEPNEVPSSRIDMKPPKAIVRALSKPTQAQILMSTTWSGTDASKPGSFTSR